MSRCSIPWLFKTSIAEILRGSVGGCRGRGMAHWPCGADGGRKVKAARVAAKRVYTTYGRKMLEGSHGGEPAREMWTPVETPAQGGWRFFKVGVEMR